MRWLIEIGNFQTSPRIQIGIATPANSAAPRKNGLNSYVRNLVVLNVFSLKKGSLIGSMISPDEIRAKLRAASSSVNRQMTHHRLKPRYI